MCIYTSYEYIVVVLMAAVAVDLSLSPFRFGMCTLRTLGQSLPQCTSNSILITGRGGCMRGVCVCVGGGVYRKRECIL